MTDDNFTRGDVPRVVPHTDNFALYHKLLVGDFTRQGVAIPRLP